MALLKRFKVTDEVSVQRLFVFTTKLVSRMCRMCCISMTTMRRPFLSVLMPIFVLLRKASGLLSAETLLAASGRSRWPGGHLLSRLPPVIRSLWLDIVQGLALYKYTAGKRRGEETDCVCLLLASFCACRVVFNT